MRTTKPLGILLILLTVLPSCHQFANAPEDRWMRTDLYFGLTRRDRSVISDADFQKFIDTTITPAFPSGLTITPASGQYLDSKNQLHKEPSRVLTVLYPMHERAAVTVKIQRIATLYCRDFDQECVLQTTVPAQTTFLYPQASQAEAHPSSQPVGAR